LISDFRVELREAASLDDDRTTVLAASIVLRQQVSFTQSVFKVVLQKSTLNPKLPHESVNLFLITTHKKHKLTVLWGS
jgi:hypothetical protein